MIQEEIKREITKIVNNNNIYNQDTGEWGYDNNGAIDELTNWVVKLFTIPDVIKSVCEICKQPLRDEEIKTVHCFNCREQDI